MPGYYPTDLPVTREAGGFCQRSREAGGMRLAFESVPAGDYGTAGVCPTPHWGYVLRGCARVTYADGATEELAAGQAYHLPAGHTIVVLEDSEVVEFSAP